jgi:sugar lactone lactonase YvrE
MASSTEAATIEADGLQMHPTVLKFLVQFMAPPTKLLFVEPHTTVGAFRLQVHANSTVKSSSSRLMMFVKREYLQDGGTELTESSESDEKTEEIFPYVQLDDDARTLGSYGFVHNIECDITVDVLVREQIFTDIGKYVSKINTQDDTQLDRPCGICMSSDGWLYVPDKEQQCVKVINASEGSLIRTIQMNGMQPNYVCLSLDETQLFVSVGNSGIQVMCTSDGTYISTIGTCKQWEERHCDDDRFSYTKGICLSLDGEYLFVADKKRVQVMSVTDGSCVQIIGSESLDHKYTEFYNPRGICLSSDGKLLFVTDGSNCRIQVFQVADGMYLRTIGSMCQFASPNDICLSKDDEYLFVVDSWNNRVQVVSVSDGACVRKFGDKEGPKLGTFGAEGLEPGPGQLYFPMGICLSPKAEFVFVTDNNRLQKFTGFQ